jgi:hypothetical protein
VVTARNQDETGESEMIENKKARWIMTVIWVGVLIQSIAPSPVAAASQNQPGWETISEVRDLIPTGLQMIDQADQVLSKGWDNLTSDEKILFNDIFDPGDTGKIDQDYINVVMKNYEKIRSRLENDIELVNAADSDQCTGQRLYYTDFFRIHICPYYTEEDRVERKVRTLIHEVAHMALLVTDRPYYDPKSYSSQYNALTPQGSWVTEIPVIGHIIREIAHTDTLYSPDTYAWFASEVE